MAPDHARLFDAVRRVHRSLGDRLCRHLDVEALRLWRWTPVGDVLVYASGDVSPHRAFAVQRDGYLLGRVEVSAALPEAAARVDDAMPWVLLVFEALDQVLEVVGGTAPSHEPAGSPTGAATGSWGFTPAQTLVFELLALGHTTAQISRALNWSLVAVEIHVGRLLRVTGARTTEEMVRSLRADRIWTSAPSPMASNAEPVVGAVLTGNRSTS